MKISKFTLPTYKTEYDSLFNLHSYQIDAFKAFEENSNALLVTKTASGKTASIVLPLLANKESGVFVYPTNALLVDQIKEVSKLMEARNIRIREITTDNVDDIVDIPFDYELIKITGETLEAFKDKFGLKNKGEVLARLSTRDCSKILFINPDILYLILTMRFSGSINILANLQGYKTLLVDEFHLYRGVELANIMFCLFLLKKLGIFSRYFFLSATPDENIQKILEDVFSIRVISAEPSNSLISFEERTILHDVELNGIVVGEKDSVTKTIEIVRDVLSEIRALKESNLENNKNGEYIPCIIITNSVIDAMSVEDALMSELGIQESEIASIRGLSTRENRSIKNKIIAVGTSAIEVGVDFKTSILIFDASNVASFLQRFGRLGRHCEGKAYLMADAMQIESLNAFGDTISRDTLENLVKILYPYQNSLSWFLNTSSGVVVISSIVQKILAQLVHKFEDTNEQTKLFILNAVDEYLKIIDAEKHRSVMLKNEEEWVKAFLHNHSFRGSSYSVPVFDKQHNTSFSVDLKMFLKKANVVSSKGETTIIDGFTKKNNKIRINRTHFTPEVFYSTSDSRFHKTDFYFLVNDAFIGLNHALWEEPHLFVVLHRAIMKVADWTQSCYPVDDNEYVIAFDSDALLLREMYKRYLK